MRRPVDSSKINTVETLNKFSVGLAQIIKTEIPSQGEEWLSVAEKIGNRGAKTWNYDIQAIIELIEDMRSILDNQSRELIVRSDSEGLATTSEALNSLSIILRVLLHPEYESNNILQPALNYLGTENGRLRIEGRGRLLFFEPLKRGYKNTMLNIVSGQSFHGDHTVGGRTQVNPGYHKVLFGVLRPLTSTCLSESKLDSFNEVLQKQFPEIMQICALGEKLGIDNKLTFVDKLDAEFRSADFIYHALLPEINPVMSIQMDLLHNEQARAVCEGAPRINQEIQSAHAKTNSHFEMDLPPWDIKDSLKKKQNIAKNLRAWYEETINHKLESSRRDSKEQAIRNRIETLDLLIRMTDEEYVQLTNIKSQLNGIESKALKVANSQLKRENQAQIMRARQEAQRLSNRASQGSSQARQNGSTVFFALFGTATESAHIQTVARAESAEAEIRLARAQRDSALNERDEANTERERAVRERASIDNALRQQEEAAREERERLEENVRQLSSRVLAVTLGALALCVVSIFLTWGVAVYGVTGFAGVIYSALYIGVSVHLPIILEDIFKVATTISIIMPIGFWLESERSLSIFMMTCGILLLGGLLLGKATLLGLIWSAYNGARLITGIFILAYTVTIAVERILIALQAAANIVFNILAACTPIIKELGRLIARFILGGLSLFSHIISALAYLVKGVFRALVALGMISILMLKNGAAKITRLLKTYPLGSLGVTALVCTFAKFGVMSTILRIKQLCGTCAYILGIVLVTYVGAVCLFLTCLAIGKGIVALSKEVTGYENPVWAVGLTAAAAVVLYFSPVKILTCIIGLAIRQNWVKDVLDRVVQWVLARGDHPKFRTSSQQKNATREESWSLNGHQSELRTSSQYGSAASEEYSHESKASGSYFFREGQSQRNWSEEKRSRGRS